MLFSDQAPPSAIPSFGSSRRTSVSLDKASFFALFFFTDFSSILKR